MSNTIDYGIDLGTTNSCIALWDSGKIRVFQNNDQMNVTPSAVHILKTGRVIVGRRAFSAIVTDPDNVAIEFKRWMGQRDRKQFTATKRELSAEELSSEILKSLREDVRRQTAEDATTAVITVPAAFGALQCEATARAAKLAGFEEAPLLQEPIAAAIGYGALAGCGNQRWLVFDLGGGTLDIAVVSTRNGRLNILEHRGNNLLGGKDIDRSIVESIFLPVLESNYNLHSTTVNSARSMLLPRLRMKAEEAKIDLSSESKIIVALLDIGTDDSGTPIELEIPVTREQIETLMEPLFEKCYTLAQEALEGARMVGGDLDRIILVGGPTQSPFLRKILSARLGAPIDFSADPMTVVARGAAVYASTLERTTKPTSEKTPDCIHIILAYEPVSAELQSTVAGRILEPIPAIEVKIEAEGGLWTSGWMSLTEGCFEVPVSLTENNITVFWVYARDGNGRLIETDTPELKIRHGLVPAAPPLPHTLSVEILNPGSYPVLDPVFVKGTPLPTEKTVRYRATSALVPDKLDSDLFIKLWEGEFLDEPNANEWVGNAVLSHEGIRRSVPEGSEIEVRIQVNASRLISVEAFVPHLNQHFSSQVYLPQREEQDFAVLAQNVTTETRKYRKRLEDIELKLSNVENESTKEELLNLHRDLDEVDVKAASALSAEEQIDPDDARRVVEESKTIQGRLSKLEHKVGDEHHAIDSAHFVELVEQVTEVVEQFGTSLEKQQLSMLRRELERAVGGGNNKTVQRICGEIDGLRWRLLFRYDWFWKEVFDSLRDPSTIFVNPDEARELIAKGQAAVVDGNGEILREIVRALWKIQPTGSAEAARDSAVRSGLRKF